MNTLPSKKLGDILREEAKERERQFNIEQAVKRRKLEEKSTRKGNKIAKEVIAGLPELLRSASKRGAQTVAVAIPDPKRTGHEDGFTAAQRHAAYKIIEWARGEGIRGDISHYDYWPEGPTGDTLYLTWGK